MNSELYYTKHKLSLNITKTNVIENDVNFFTYDLTNLENAVSNIQQKFKQNTDISNNIFIGNNTLTDNKGYNNIGIGYKSGFNNDLGYNNTYLGYNTKSSSINYNSTAIGANSEITDSLGANLLRLDAGLVKNQFFNDQDINSSVADTHYYDRDVSFSGAPVQITILGVQTQATVAYSDFAVITL